MARLESWVLAAVSIATPLPAQRLKDLAAGVSTVSRCDVAQQFVVAGCEAPAIGSALREAGVPPWSIVLSAILPGSGQAAMGSSRAFAYLTIEAFAWSSFAHHTLQYRRHRDGYRDLAAAVARAPFSEARPNGDFAYYERMTHYEQSGRYDLIAGGGVDPETDTATYNGAVWLLARRTYWRDPSMTPDTSSIEWTRAVAFYQSRAYDQLYRWSWTDAPREYAEFRSLIGESNDANRLAMLDLGVVIANHVLSTIDAYIVVRLHHDPRRREFAIEGRLPLPSRPR